MIEPWWCLLFGFSLSRLLIGFFACVHLLAFDLNGGICEGYDIQWKKSTVRYAVFMDHFMLRDGWYGFIEASFLRCLSGSDNTPDMPGVTIINVYSFRHIFVLSSSSVFPQSTQSSHDALTKIIILLSLLRHC